MDDRPPPTTHRPLHIDGFLNVRKEPGPTSHDVVAVVRRIFGTRRVGHAGTLDPLAQGVLPLALGRATRLLDLLADADKEYEAEIELGLRTSTDDDEGEVLDRRSVPDFSPADLDAALRELVGQLDQRPPAFSAAKIAGRRAYDLARRGQQVALSPRRVTVYQLERQGWSSPILRVWVHCSKGTYVRALARDLGERLSVGASLRRLVRLRVGPFQLDQAVSLEQLRSLGTSLLLPPDTLLLDEPAITLIPEELEHLRHGRPWPAAAVGARLARAYAPDGRFAGLLAHAEGFWRPKINFLD
jgi:tRNA pseudouridine55 synthase